MGRYEGYKEEQDGDRRLQAAIFLCRGKVDRNL